MNSDHYIKVTGIDLVQLTKHAYDLSSPVGMGFLHFKPEPLSDEEAAHIAEHSKGWDGNVSLDYVNGRAVKLSIYASGNDLYMPRSWYDHRKDQYTTLLLHCGVSTDQIERLL